VCVAHRGMPEVRFGSDVYLWGPTRKRARDALAHHREPIGLSGWWGVLFASPPTANNWLLSGHRGAIFGGACVGVRKRKHLRSKNYKEQVGLATHDSTTATQ
jgi:hypothetical protein